MIRRRPLLSLITCLTLATPLLAGPPWIAIELPPNPFDPATRGALLVVRTLHHRGDADQLPTGRAIGLVDGGRKTVPLSFERTSRPGAYALRNSWGERGEWSLLIATSQDHGDAAEALVRVSGGRVIGVEVATGPSRWAELPVVPRRFTEAEIEASLRGRTGL